MVNDLINSSRSHPPYVICTLLRACSAVLWLLCEWIKSKLSHFTSEPLSFGQISLTWAICYIGEWKNSQQHKFYTCMCADHLCAAADRFVAFFVCRVREFSIHFLSLSLHPDSSCLWSTRLLFRSAVTSQTILWLFHTFYFVTSIIRLVTANKQRIARQQQLKLYQSRAPPTSHFSHIHVDAFEGNLYILYCGMRNEISNLQLFLRRRRSHSQLNEL